MQLFNEYLQPITEWLNIHSNWALIITFFISFSESLAIIGSIVPGSVTMTAIGILAGSGVMRIDLTFIAAALGAIAGDGASYFLGFHYSDRLTQVWPFSRYPSWLFYGKDFFSRHGGKSVLFGRFVGPLRSIIPVIAGMMRMSHWQFFLANTISAVGWSILYVGPGVLIGAASTELSAEGATRLIGLILILLIIIWLTSILLKRIFLYLNHSLRIQLYYLWEWTGRHPALTQFLERLMPVDESNRYSTLVLLLLFVICIICTLTMIALVIHNHWIAVFNHPAAYFLHSLRTYSIDNVFFILKLMFSPLSLGAVYLVVAGYALFLRNWILLAYWTSLVLSCLLVNYGLTYTIKLPLLVHILTHAHIPLFPGVQMMLTAAMLSFLLFYSYTYPRLVFFHFFQVLFLTLLFLAGIGEVYLGNNWPSSIFSAYLIGFTLSLFHWILFRRNFTQARSPFILPFVVCISLVITTSFGFNTQYKYLQREYLPYSKQFSLSHSDWWHQNPPLLPLYTTNRLGKKINLFNIQYAGNLSTLEQALIKHGWVKQPNSLFSILLMRFSGQEVNKALLSLSQLYLNKTPILTMTHQDQAGIYILRLWQSNYQIRQEEKTIWLGSIVYTSDNATKTTMNQSTLFQPILPAIDDFSYTSISVPTRQLKMSTTSTSPKILIINESKH